MRFIITCVILGVSLGFTLGPLNGKHRRALRSIANRLKKEKLLPIVQFTLKNDIENPLKNINSLLDLKELLVVKIDAEQSKVAKEVGELVASHTKSEIVQSLGHTVLLFRPHPTNNIISKLLESELSKPKI